MTGIQKTEQGCHNPGVSEAVSLGVEVRNMDWILTAMRWHWRV